MHYLLSSAPFSPFLFSSFSTYTLIFPRILPLSTNSTCLAFLGPFDIQIQRWTREANYTLIIPTHLHFFLPICQTSFTRGGPPISAPRSAFDLKPSLCQPVCSSHLTCIPAYTIEKHAKNKSWTISTLSPASPSHHRFPRPET